MLVLRTDEDLQQRRRALGDGPGGMFVPTMGALHAGHADLIRRGAALARERGDRSGCVVSLFVNPTQFNERADFERYPKDEAADLALCERCGAAAVFAPSLATMYPPPPAPPVPVPPLPPVATEPGLEDAFRPGHFAGVCQVVMRLFELVRPRGAILGEKDWQQLRVIASMTQRASLPVEIIPAPITRDPDGLALSSRNRFLSASDRQSALAIPRALAAASKETTPVDAEASMSRTLANSGLIPEYAVVRDAATLRPIDRAGSPARALIAARVGTVRLIDNSPWPV